MTAPLEEPVPLVVGSPVLTVHLDGILALPMTPLVAGAEVAGPTCFHLRLHERDFVMCSFLYRSALNC